MLPGGTLDAFFADPVGRYMAGPTFLYFYARPTLCGFLIWGKPSESDLERLVRILRVELTPVSQPHVSLVDASRVETVDASAFGVLTTYVTETFDLLQEKVQRLALVRPTGLMGAVAAGFYHVLSRPYPVELFATAPEALAWLGAPDDGVLAELDALFDEATGTSPILRELRGVIEAKLGDVSLATVSRALGVSERMLQRRLRDAGTTFQNELNTAQVRVAKRLLLESDAKLSSIALDIGCASLQHFSGLFRKLTGETPSQFRARHRGGA